MHLRMEQVALGLSTSEPGVAVGRLGVVCAPAQVCPGLCVSQFGGALLRRCLGLALSRPSSTCPSSTHSLPVQRCSGPAVPGWVLLRFGAAPVWGCLSLEISWFAKLPLRDVRFGPVPVRRRLASRCPGPVPPRPVPAAHGRHLPAASDTHRHRDPPATPSQPQRLRRARCPAQPRAGGFRLRAVRAWRSPGRCGGR